MDVQGSAELNQILECFYRADDFDQTAAHPQMGQPTLELRTLLLVTVIVAVVLLLKVPVGSVGFPDEQDVVDPSNDNVPCLEVFDSLVRHRRELPPILLLVQLGRGESQKVSEQHKQT